MWERTPATGQWRLLLYAVAATLLVFAGLPLLELLTTRPAPERTARVVDVAPPRPPPPPVPVVAVPMDAALSRAVPQFTEPRATLKVPSVDVALHLPLLSRSIAGDLTVAFPLAPEGTLSLPMDSVFDLTEADSPPRPIARLSPLYPPRARLRRIEGDVQVEFVVTPEGAVRDAVVVQATPSDVFEQTALQAVQHWRFDPGLKDGQPIAVRVRQKLTFMLED